MARIPLGLTAYRYATAALSPAVPFLLHERGRRGKEDPSRSNERLGLADKPRPLGTLIWVHGASVGECLSALPLIETLLQSGERRVLVTSGTVSSAKLMRERLPEGAIHQFVPVDTPAATAKFLDHWRPDIGLFVDSDIWPNLVLGAKARGVRLALVNARMAKRSFEGWQWARGSANALLAAFDVCLAQDEEIATRFKLLGARDVRVTGNLKADAPPLPVDPQKLEKLSRIIAGRPILLAAQTHPGEDETVLPAHDKLRNAYPDLLTIIVPRHVERAGEIEMLCGARSFARRSRGEEPTQAKAVYIADTIGELGLFYRLTPFAFVGGSLIRHGGQNPLEPARLSCGVLAGPHTWNFTTAYAAIFRAQGIGLVRSSTDIAAAAMKFFAQPEEVGMLGKAAAAGAAMLGGAVARTVATIEKLLVSHAHA